MALYLICILCLATALRIIGLSQSFWLDEAAQAVLSKNPYLAGHFNADFQPPLFYYMSNIWMTLGSFLGTHAEWFLRLPSVFFGVASVWFLYKLIFRISKSQKAGLVASLLLATAPFHIYYSQEFRMYSLLTFLYLASWYYMWEEKYRTSTFINLLAVFTHYFGFVIIAAQTLYIFITKRKSSPKFVVTQSLMLLPFLVWIPTFFIQLKASNQLISAWPGWANLSNVGFFKFPITTLAKFTVGMISPQPKWLYGAVVAFFTCICMWTVAQTIVHLKKQPKHSKDLVFISFMWIAPLLFVWIGGIWISAATPWRIQFVLPALYGLIALSTQHSHKVFTFFVSLLVIQNLFFSTLYLTRPHFQRENWRDAIAYSDEKAGRGAAIVTEFDARFAPMDWYSRLPAAYVPGSTTKVITSKTVQEALKSSIQSHKTILVYSYLFELSDPSRQLEKYLTENGYNLTEEKDFRGVGIVRTYTPN